MVSLYISFSKLPHLVDKPSIITICFSYVIFTLFIYFIAVMVENPLCSKNSTVELILCKPNNYIYGLPQCQFTKSNALNSLGYSRRHTRFYAVGMNPETCGW